jgi:molybdate transport system ATP-binding protein
MNEEQLITVVDKPGPDSAKAAEIISFESHRQLLRDEAKAFNESRFNICHKRATVSSYLFPELYPVDPEYPDGYDGFTHAITRVSPMPVPDDAGSEHPLLAGLERAACSGLAEWLLRELSLFDLRHQPVFGLSTGEGRKTMLIQSLLSPSRLLVLDEAFDGLDVASRKKLRDVLQTVLKREEWSRSALAVITHRREDYEGLSPTHALLLGQGINGTEYQVGEWDSMTSAVDTYFESQHAAEQAAQWSQARQHRNEKVTKTNAEPANGEPLVELKNVQIRYPTSVVFNPPLTWTVSEGQKWVVAGGNGSGKSTLLEIITGENMKAYTQDVWLFGKKKGGGISVWDIKAQLGVLSTEFHMTYVDYADPSVRSFAHKPTRVTTWEVVCSGFFDSIGLYDVVSPSQERIVREWVNFFDIRDLISFPPRSTGRGRLAKDAHKCPNFFELSQGQQKLVLLCRAMVKKPRLLLLDEPTHGLSGYNRDRLLNALIALADRPDVAIVYVTHRSDEIDALGFDHVLDLGNRSRQNTLDSESLSFSVPDANQSTSQLS